MRWKFREQYQLKIGNTFAAFENVDGRTHEHGLVKISEGILISVHTG